MTDRLDVVVTGGTIVSGGGVRRADIGIADGRIAAIADRLAGEAPRSLEADGLHVLPGAIDAHVHINEPGRTSWEGFRSGTSALAAGGATTFVEMPLNSRPPTTTVQAFEQKRVAAERSSRIDFGLWGGLVPGNIDEMPGLARGGAFGFKAFMCDSGNSDFPASDERVLREGMVQAKELGLPVAVHAESDELTRELASRARASGRTDVAAYLSTRPPEAEWQAIELALALAAETGCSLHIVHVSTGRGVALVAEARSAGVDATCETCPHYLVLTEEDFERLGNIAKCAPPLRPSASREELWAAIADRTLPMVASDHSPCPPSLKDGDVMSSWGGIDGAQTTLALLLSEGHHLRGVPLELVAEIASAFPARRFGLAGKGSVEIGNDADLALVALDDRHRLERDALLTRHRQSPFVGRPMHGRVLATVLRGELVHQHGLPTGPPRGRMRSPQTRG